MTNVIIAGRRFEDVPSFSYENGERRVTIAVPYDTERSVIFELQDAMELQVTDPLGREIIGNYRLVGWRGIETFLKSNGVFQYLITWAIPNLDETENLKKRITELENENEDLTQVILELAAYIGGAEEV